MALSIHWLSVWRVRRELLLAWHPNLLELDSLWSVGQTEDEIKLKALVLYSFSLSTYLISPPNYLSLIPSLSFSHSIILLSLILCVLVCIMRDSFRDISLTGNFTKLLPLHIQIAEKYTVDFTWAYAKRLWLKCLQSPHYYNLLAIKITMNC